MLVIVSALCYFAYNYIDTKNQLSQISNSETKTNEENKKLVNDIGKYIELPGETPTVATVNDASKLNHQEFFKNAKNGDKVLVFSESGRALLYRPSTQKVIEYSKVSFSSEQSQ